MKLEEYGKDGQVDTKAALELTDVVVEATRIAQMEMRNLESNNGKPGEGDEADDQEVNADMKLFGKRKHKGNMHNKGFQGKSFAKKRQRKF